MTVTRIGSVDLVAEISANGAELVSLQTAAGVPLLWHGDPAWWSGRAPLLFPIVGRVPGDEIVVEGRAYPLKQHGFARTSLFQCMESSAQACRFALHSSPATRACYPFDFALDITYAIEGRALTVRAEVWNREAAREMPFSFGFHPAFLWPMRGLPREGHALAFAARETAPVARPHDGLLATAREPNPVDGNGVLSLRDGDFEAGAFIFDDLASCAVTYRAGDKALLTVEFPEMPHLGVWTKPGAPFICIEPWHGFAAPFGFQGELATKPGIIRLAPGARRAFEMRIIVHC